MTVQGRLPLFAANTLMSVMSIDLPFAASHPFISDRHSANYRIEQMWRDASNFYWVFKRQEGVSSKTFRSHSIPT